MKKYELTQKEKEDLKELVEKDGFNFLLDIETAKDNLKILANSVKDRFGIEPVMFKKLVKTNYKQSIDDERVKFSVLEMLWKDVFGNKKDTEED